MWTDSDGDFWLAIRALVSGGDSSKRLGDVRLALLDPADRTIYKTSFDRVIWTSTADFKRRVVPARSFHTPPSREEFCKAIGALEPSSGIKLELSITGGNAMAFSETYSVDKELIAEVQSFCEA
jgi:hypothetical protein